MKVFTTAVEAAEAQPEEGTPFEIDGFECHYIKPSDTQIALLMAQMGKFSTIPEQIAGIVNFFVQALDDESYQYVVGRLMDRRDPFGIDQIQEILAWMMEEWTGRPTQPPSVSTESPPNGGQKSTRRTTKSTSSRSLPIGS